MVEWVEVEEWAEVDEAVVKVVGEEPEDLVKLASKADGGMIKPQEQLDLGEAVAKIWQEVGAKHLKPEVTEAQAVTMVLLLEAMGLVVDMALVVKVNTSA